MTQTETKNIRFGHSPDPDDAFMFYAFEKETIPMQGFKVTHVMEDIETLNQRAIKDADKLEVTAVSCHAYAHIAENYAVMRSGASIGDQYGPMLVARKQGIGDGELGMEKLTPEDLKGKKIAIPGKLTTAFLVLQLFDAMNGRGAVSASGQGNPAPTFEVVYTPFDQILNDVEQGKVDLGLVIHEGQLTYESQNLKKVLDLGEWWFEQHGLPLPLGVDVIRRDLGEETMVGFAKLFRASIEHSLENRKPALDYAMKYGRDLTDELNDKFVGMYVNEATVDMGERGEKAFQLLLDLGFEKGIIPKKVKLDIVG